MANRPLDEVEEFVEVGDVTLYLWVLTLPCNLRRSRWRAALRLSRSLCLLRALASSFWRSLYLWVLTLVISAALPLNPVRTPSLTRACPRDGPRGRKRYRHFTLAQIRPLHCTISRRSAITAVATCCRYLLSLLAVAVKVSGWQKRCKNRTKMRRNTALSCTWCAGKVKTNSQYRSPCWAWLYPYIHYLNVPAVLSSCANLNLGDISRSRFRSYAHCHGLTKAILFSSPVWGVAYSVHCLF